MIDANENDYDWLVVYDDLPPVEGERFSLRHEPVLCHPDNTLLVTIEPPSVKYYGQRYTRQFGHVLTTQPEKYLPHPRRIYNQAGLYWFYGLGQNHQVSLDQMRQRQEFEKHHDLSVVWSNKQQRHTTLFQRYKFLQRLKRELPELDIFGAGHRALDDKADCLDDYRYHITVENYQGLHHWTEKIADVFLGHCLPFYYGCPNLADYFPEESFIPIDIFNIDHSIKIIKQAIVNNEYHKREAAITEARRRVMDNYNIFQILSEIIQSRHNSDQATEPSVICSRRAANQGNIFQAADYQLRKQITRTMFTVQGWAKEIHHG